MITADRIILTVSRNVEHIDDPRDRLARQVGELQGYIRTLGDKLDRLEGVSGREPDCAYETVYAEDAPILMEYEYTPGEAACFNVESPEVGPGTSPSVELGRCLISGEWISPLDVFTPKLIDLWVQQILGSEIDSAREEREYAMQERRE
jgi:hypothetical protein